MDNVTSLKRTSRRASVCKNDRIRLKLSSVYNCNKTGPPTPLLYRQKSIALKNVLVQVTVRQLVLGLRCLEFPVEITQKGLPQEGMPKWLKGFEKGYQHGVIS